MKPVGEPSEVANAILFLASSKASFITAVSLQLTEGSRRID
jgi:NAD(P)-dependent dehydrogenase (short-subunit alcohol dehydrogenase family)